MNNKLNKWNILKILYIVAAFLFVVPSFIYFIEGKTLIDKVTDFNFLLNGEEKINQTIVYISIIVIIVVLYLLIIKFRKKLFKNIKSTIIFISIISLIFVCSLPLFSSDVFYYMGIGRINSEYGQNPYYVSIEEYVENEKTKDLSNDITLYKGYTNAWADKTVVYGPIWTMICAFITKITFGSADLCLFAFKLLNLIIHILNCYYIYKITNKKIFVIIYGLNPFIIIESMVNVHNDIFMIFFIVLALYQLLKKKNIFLSVLFLAMATCIKYFAVLFLPFIIIYYFRKEKKSVKLLKCIQYGLIFAFIVAIPYMFYIRDLEVFSGMAYQQNKYAKSIGVIIYKYSPGNQRIIGKLLYFFIFCYAIKNILLLVKPKIELRKEMKHLLYIMIAFVFVLITNFQPWYIMWLFPIIMWQNPRHIRLIIQISIIALFDYAIFIAYEDTWKIGANFSMIMLSSIVFFTLVDNVKRVRRYIKKRKKEKNEGISCR